MQKMQIVGLGESLVDFLAVEGEDTGSIHMEGNAGGAPANVLAMAAKLGRKTAFIGKVGRDVFGRYLMRSVLRCGIDTAGMVAGGEPTTLAMVTLDESGNRSFAFYRSGTADVMLQEYEVDMQLVEGCEIFHFGAVSMTAPPARQTTLAAAARARKAGARVSFDPNYRPMLWPDADAAVKEMARGMELADYVKLSDEEARMLTGERDPEKAAMMLMARHGFRFLAVTLGPDGCIGVSPSARIRLPAYDVATVDTTGAGDAFWGAVLHRLLEGDGELAGERLADMLAYGNAAGSLTTTLRGAIAAQPTDKEIRRCMKTTPPLKR